MKRCPVCDTGYEDHHTTCGRDGARLIASRELAPGTVVNGKYRIVKLLGRGGMGSVYLAEQILMRRLRALKFLSSELSQEPKFLERFLREARIELRHPNVVEVIDLEQAEDGSPYIAMEYVEGIGLREAIAAGPMPVERAVAIVRGIALGLGAAHAKGIIHRDVKPENIRLSTIEGVETPKLLDFGIAAMKESSTLLSRTRGLMLTPEYAAPEQWKGLAPEQLDGRVDFYALGGVFHEMLTGRTGLHSQNTDGWMYQHLHGERIMPSKLRPELAYWSGLDAFVMRMTAREREGRPASVAEVVRELDAVQLRRPAAPMVRPAPTMWEGKHVAYTTPANDKWPRAASTLGRGPERSSGLSVARRFWLKSVLVLFAVGFAIYAIFALRYLWIYQTLTSPAAPLVNYFQSTSLDHEQQRCDRGDADSCISLGVIFGGLENANYGVPIDLKRAVAYYTKACDDSLQRGCWLAGNLYGHGGKGIDKDATKAMNLFKKGCDRGDDLSCKGLERLRDGQELGDDLREDGRVH